MRIFFLIFFILGTIGLLLFSHLFTKENINTWTGVAKNAALQGYPSGLVLDISAASWVVTNASGPVVFSKDMIVELFSWAKFMSMYKNSMNNGWSKETNMHKWYDTNGMNPYENILVIDTASTGNIESYNTMALLTKTQLIIQARANEKRVYEVASAMQGQPAIHITPESAKISIESAANNVMSNSDKITGVVYTFIAITLLIALIIGSFFVWLFSAIVLYLYALIVRLVSKALQTEYTYQQAYSMSVLWFTLPFLLILSSTWFKIILLCIIVGRVMYLHKKRNTKKD
jgi:hypothetical protein